MRSFYIYFSFFIDCKCEVHKHFVARVTFIHFILQIDSLRHTYLHQSTSNKVSLGIPYFEKSKKGGSAILSTNNLILSALIWPQNFEKKKGLLIMNKNRSSKNCARVDFSVYVILSLFFCHVNFALVAGVRFSSTFFCHFYTHTQHREIVLI